MFDEDRYFDVFVEYAKASPEDMLIQITSTTAAPSRPSCTSCRRSGSATSGPGTAVPDRPTLEQIGDAPARSVVKAVDPELGERYLYCEGDVPLLFTENETNTQRIFGVPNRSPYVKDGINDYVVHGQEGAVNPEKTGTKARRTIASTVNPGECQVIRLRLSDVAPGGPGRRATAQQASPFGSAFRRDAASAPQEADEFYAAVTPAVPRADAANVMRQALAGMLWSKQFYHYDVDKWLEERGSDPFKANAQGRAAQRPLAPHVQRRRHLDAGQVGVPLVRRLGPGLPRARPDARRSRTSASSN